MDEVNGNITVIMHANLPYLKVHACINRPYTRYTHAQCKSRAHKMFIWVVTEWGGQRSRWWGMNSLQLFELPLGLMNRRVAYIHLVIPSPTFIFCIFSVMSWSSPDCEHKWEESSELQSAYEWLESAGEEKSVLKIPLELTNGKVQRCTKLLCMLTFHI